MADMLIIGIAGGSGSGKSTIARLIAETRGGALRYTQCTPHTAFGPKQVMILDTVGLLASVYGYATWSYIGGGFGVGIHNTLEAAVYGIPVIFGPNHRKFNEAVNLIREGGGFCIHDMTEARQLLDSLLGNPAIAEAAGAKALRYVDSQLGATDTICKELALNR